jgi:hypothetical protein
LYVRKKAKQTGRTLILTGKFPVAVRQLVDGTAVDYPWVNW